jgi:hypothetical protein
VDFVDGHVILFWIIYFFVSREEERLFFQNCSRVVLGCFSGLESEMALGCVEKCRKKSCVSSCSCVKVI